MWLLVFVAQRFLRLPYSSFIHADINGLIGYRPHIRSLLTITHSCGSMKQMRREKIGYLLAVLMDMCMMGTIFFSVTRRAADGGVDAMRLGCLAGVVFIV